MRPSRHRPISSQETGRRVGSITGRAGVVLIALAMLAVAPAAPQVLVQEYYVPLPETDVRIWADAIQDLAENETINSIISLTVTADGTVVYYDHWENGYEIDPTTPLTPFTGVPNDPGTQIWGDGNALNGAPPGFPGDVLSAGNVIILDSDVPLGPTNFRDPAQTFFDGRDKFVTTEPLAVTRAAWPSTGVEAQLGGAVEVFDTERWGTMFEAPVGENAGPAAFEFVAFSIMAQEDGTTVDIDLDGNGTTDQTLNLNQGENALVGAAGVTDVLVGATVTATTNVQVDLITANEGTTYEGRWYSQVPTADWGNLYFSPVASTVTGDEVHVYLYNPSAGAITVTFDQTTGCNDVVVPGGQEVEVTLAITSPLSAARFESDGTNCVGGAVTGGDFFAIATTDRNATIHDWGFTLIPESSLTPSAVVGWAPGSTDNSQNANPVWVTAVDPMGGATTLYVDLDGDPTSGPLTDIFGNMYDYTVAINNLETVQVFDGNSDPPGPYPDPPATPPISCVGGDCDQTGLRIYTVDGTRITAAWGQDPFWAYSGEPVQLDMGTTVLPFSSLTAFKDAALLDGNGNGGLDPGEGIRYTIRIRNVGIIPISDIDVIDTLDPNTTYVPESTERDGMAIADDLTGTPFPLDNNPVATGYPLVVSPATLDPGDEIVLTFVVTANDPLPVNVSEIVNTVRVSSDAEIFLDAETTPVTRGDLSVTKVSSAAGEDVVPGETITYTVTTTNTSAATVTGVRIQDPVPAGTTYVAQSTVVTGPRQIFVQDLFQASSFANNDGPSTWEADWVETDPPGADAGPGAGNIQVTLGQLQMNGPINHSIAREVDLGAIAGAGATVFLSFDYDTTGNLDEGFDVMVLEVDDGSGFTVVQTFDGDVTASPVIDLSSFASVTATDPLAIRFRVTNTIEAGELVFIDDLWIRATEGGSTATHDFATADYSAGTGWSGPWIETNDPGPPLGATGGSIRITGGELLLEGSATNPVRIVERQVDLSNAAFAFLSFDWRCVGDTEPAQDFVYIEAFDDNTMTWETLQTKEGDVDMCLEPGDNDSGSELFRLDNSIGLTANARIRFRYTMSATDEDFFVDNVLIRAGEHVSVTKDNVPAGGNEDLLDGLPPSLAVPDDEFALRPGESVTATFQVTVDIPPTVPNVVNTVSVTAFEVTEPRRATVVDRIIPGGAIGDTVWLDTDRDGILDVGEPGLANVRVWLDTNGNGSFDAGVDLETTTNANGQYVFAGLLPGTYQVFVDEGTLPAPLVIAPGSVNPYPSIQILTDDQFFDADFGYTSPPETAVIGDWIWHDTDGDGIQDPGEIGIPGVAVNLYDPATMMIVAMTTSGPDGRYYFAGVTPGEYVVELDPSNFNPGGALDPASGWVVTMGPQSEGSDRSNPVTVIGGDVVTEIDFGYRNPNLFTIADVIWIDGDGDGILDPMESGVAGVTVSLLDDMGNVVGTTTSGADGSFSFSGVAGGGSDYTIRIDDIMDLLEDYTGTTPPALAASLMVTVNAMDVSGINFGYNAPGQIGDLIWSDDGDGVREPGEPGIAGVLVNLVDPATSTVVATAVTGADGTYLFTSVNPGAYVVEVDASNFVAGGPLEMATQTFDPSEPGGPCAVCNGQGSTSVSINTSDLDQDFAYSRPALPNISGTVFEDFDRDGVEEAGEPGIPGVTVALIPTFSINNGFLDVNGDGMIDATDDGFADGVEVINGELDMNGNGVIDPSDDGLFNGAAVVDGVFNLDGDGTAGEVNGDDSGVVEGPPAATTTTDGLGDYAFVDVPEGTYEVRVTDTARVLDGYTLTSGLDSIPVSAVAGMDITDIDFGYIRDEERASIGDRVWYDADRDGVQDASEGGIPGVTLNLVDVGPDGQLGTADDGATVPTTTDANGNYVFSGLDSGNYVVDLTDTGMVLAGLGLTGGADPTATISLSEGEDYNDADFGYGSAMGTSAIGDTVWYDADGDGFEDPGEIGILGVTVRLIDPGPDGAINTADDVGVVGTMVTDALGRYLFTGLAGSRYYVEIDTTTLPAGYGTTPTNGNAQRPFDIPMGLDVLYADFGFNGGTTGTIGDKVYLDADGDGMQDPLEPGLGGVTIDLIDDATGMVIATTVSGDGTTDVNGDGMVDANDLGYYEFSGLPPGDYNVVVTDIDTVLADLNPTETPGLPINVPITGGLIDTVDFGYAPSEGTGTIGGTVWHDVNQVADIGVLDPDETGIEGVTVELWLDTNGNGIIEPGTDNLIRMATTDENGDYAFLGIPFGDYLVDVTDDAGVLTGFQNVLGPNPTLDNNGQTDPYRVVLDAGNSSNFTADFGYEATNPQILTGTAFFDVNGDGIFDDPAETGVDEVMLFLFRDLDGDGMLDPGEPQIGSTLVSDGTIDVDGDMIIDPVGFYAFVDLPSGTYIVSADPSQSFVDGLEQTTQLAPPQPQGGVQAVTIPPGMDSADNDFGFTIRATAVLLSGFEARSDAGGVRVRWETASQSGTVGFYLYRLDDRAGWVQVNEQMLPAVLDAPQGAVYELVDDGAPSRVKLTYTLVEVEAAGGERVYGPFEPSVDARPVIGVEPERKPQATPRKRSARMEGRLEAMKAASARATMAIKSTDPRNPRRPGRRPPKADLRLKIEVERDGLYYVGAEEIASTLGLPVGQVRLAIRYGGLALSRGGEPVAWTQAPDGLYFHGRAIESPYTASNVYWLDLGPGVRMEMAAAVGVVGGAASFAERAHFEEDSFSVTVVPQSSVEDFYYWAFVMAGTPASGTATVSFEVLDPVAGSAARLGLSLQGVTSTPASVDHQAVLRLNGVEIGSTSWDGAVPHEVWVDLPADLVLAGSNTLEVEGVLEGGLPYSTFLVDSLDLSYERSLRAVEDRLVFEPGVAGAVSVSGFSAPGVALYDVTSPDQPVRLEGALETVGDGWTIGFTSSSESSRYLAVGGSGVDSPPAVRSRPKSKVGTDRGGVEYVVIAPSALTASAESLVDYRAGFGLSGRVYELEEIQDVFSGGLSSPEAVRDFLRFAYDEWATVPRFAVLAGGGTFDYKDVQGIGGNLVPPLMSATPYGLFATDSLFGDLVGEDGVPEIAVGRIPALTDAELGAYVEKMALHESSGGAGKVLFVADDGDDAGDFPAANDALAALVPEGVVSEKVYLSEHAVADARQLIFDAVASGVRAVNYLGHGGLNRLADEGVLLSADAEQLVGPQMPLFATLTCSAGRFEVPGFESLAEALVMTPDAGAAAVFAPTGQSLNFEAVEMNKVWIDALFAGANATVGEAVLETLGYEQVGSFPFMRKIFNLIGDPAFGIQ